MIAIKNRILYLLIDILCNILISLSQQIKNRMSLQPKSKNVRVLSAKITHNQAQRIRPMSGVPNHSYTRRQMIETVYNSQGSEPNRIYSARQPAVNIISQNLENDRPIRKTSKQAKQKEQMASQILGLKQTVNRLVQELSFQKGKCENMRKKSLKYSKILTMEFEDEKQWNSNAVNNHLVTGIKNMYDTLKEKYQAKCQEFDNFIKKQQATNHMENQQYTKVLEGQIKNMKKKMQKNNELNLNSVFSSQTQRHANQFVIADLQNEKAILIQKNKQLDRKVKQMTQSLKEFQLKVQLDKKLIIEKDNNLHAFDRKNKELTKQNQKIKQLNLILDQDLAQMKQKYEQQVQSYKLYVTGSQLKCQKEVQSISKIKDAKIQLLEQDNAYLHKMIQQLRSTNLELNKSNQQLREQNIKNSTNGHSDYQNHINQSVGMSKINHKTQNKAANSLINTIPMKHGKRIPQKADKKYHENAIKTRKIQIEQILQIAELIKLKLIAQEFSIDNVRKFFDFKQQDHEESKDKEWQRQYITMAQVKQIFIKSPFNLDEQDSTILSRYLIEDIQEDYVYCDDLNENHRDVVKAIVKNLIQEYPIYHEGCPEYYQMNDAIDKYGKNLKSALKTIAKSGTVSKGKLVQTMKSIGMEVSSNILQLILSKMALKANKLSLLDYNSIL